MGVLSEFSTEPTPIEGLVRFRLKRIQDKRGTLTEFWRDSDFKAAGLPDVEGWSQGNVVHNRRGTIRGIHGEKMHKYVVVAQGRILTAHVDLRPDSPTRGQTFTATVEEGEGMMISPGIGNGFQALEPTLYLYRFSQEWSVDIPKVSVDPLDPALGIRWPIRQYIISDQDKAQPKLEEALAMAKEVYA